MALMIQPEQQRRSGDNIHGWSALQSLHSREHSSGEDRQGRDGFTQAGERYRSLKKTDQKHMVSNLVADLSHVTDPAITRCAIEILYFSIQCRKKVERKTISIHSFKLYPPRVISCLLYQSRAS
jgi:catalase